MPKKLLCPNCNEPSFSAWRKQTLGPVRKIRCRLCGARISVSTIRSVPMILLAMAIPIIVALALFEYGWVASAILVVALFAVLALYQHYCVPLVVRARPEEE